MKTDVSVALVILHYLLFEETVKAVEAFEEKIDTDNYQIVIVDNNSNNGSYEKLSDYFKDRKEIHLIHNSDNLGFSAGNNRGISYARKLGNFDFILVSNNDVYLNCDNLASNLEKEYSISPFAVAGPSIINTNSEDHVNVNPYKYKLPEPELYGNENRRLEGIKRDKKSAANLLRYVYHLIKKQKYVFYNLLHHSKIKGNIKKVAKYNSRYYKEANKEYNVILHGCFLVFSKKFFEQYDGFDEMLYMYGEETLLYYNLCEADLISVYLPEISVIHNHASSTKALNDSGFFMRNWAESAEKLNRKLYFS